MTLHALFRLFRPASLALLLAVAAAPVRAATPVHAPPGDGPAVVATIKPVHSLVASVMAGVAEPRLLIAGGGSPHGYALRPSEARALERATLVFWIGPDLETFLVRPLKTLARGARIIALDEAPGLHGTTAHRDAERPAGKADEIHGHERDHEHGHDHGGGDPHIWLDPVNAAVMVRTIATALTAADPAHAAAYEANAARMAARLDRLTRDMAARLAPVADQPFITFHDAYGHLVRRFGLAWAGAVTISPDRPPEARRVRELRAKIKAAQAVCVFSEPQFRPRLIDTLTEGTGARTGLLDPLGAGLAPGPELYFTLMDGNAAALRRCLGAGR